MKRKLGVLFVGICMLGILCGCSSDKADEKTVELEENVQESVLESEINYTDSMLEKFTATQIRMEELIDLFNEKHINWIASDYGEIWTTSIDQFLGYDCFYTYDTPGDYSEPMSFGSTIIMICCNDDSEFKEAGVKLEEYFNGKLLEGYEPSEIEAGETGVGKDTYYPIKRENLDYHGLTEVPVLWIAELMSCYLPKMNSEPLEFDIFEKNDYTWNFYMIHYRPMEESSYKELISEEYIEEE